MINLPTLSGPVVEPLSGSAKSVVILLHGYGANGDDLIGLASPLSKILPDTVFMSPNAPNRCAQNPFGGLQWFDVWEGDDYDRLSQIELASATINAFIDSQLERLDLSDKNLALLGFSQGTMLSLHVGVRRIKCPAGILGYSGRLEAPEKLADEILVRPPIMLIHGEMDEMVPFDSMAEAEAGLSAVDFSVQTVACPGLGHGIDPSGLQNGGNFLKAAFSG